MKIRYRKKRLKRYVLFGTLWLLFGIVAVLLNTDNVFNYGYLFIGLLYFATYFFENSKQYLTITEEMISRNRLFPETMRLADIDAIEKRGERYILKSETEEMSINIKLIDETSLLALEALLEKLKPERK